MHAEAYAWVRQHATQNAVAVLDIGGRDINGSPRPLFPNATVYRVLDIREGEGVDIVADAATWEPDREYDVVVCTEVFEHAEFWRDILWTAYLALRPGGQLILTMAGPGRPVHSGVDGGPVLHEDEHYDNVDPLDLMVTLALLGFHDFRVEELTSSHDVRAVAYS